MVIRLHVDIYDHLLRQMWDNRMHTQVLKLNSKEIVTAAVSTVQVLKTHAALPRWIATMRRWKTRRAGIASCSSDASAKFLQKLSTLSPVGLRDNDLPSTVRETDRLGACHHHETITSLAELCREERPAALRQLRPWVPRESTVAPQMFLVQFEVENN